MTTQYDPQYIQVDKAQAASILACSTKELDRMRREDPTFPPAFAWSDAPNAKVRFRLSDIYAYSARLMGGE